MNARKSLCLFLLAITILQGISNTKHLILNKKHHIHGTLDSANKHSLQSDQQQPQASLTIPSNWFNALTFDITNVDQTCKNIHTLSVVYERFLAEFKSITKEGYIMNLDILDRTKAIMTSVRESIKKYRGVTSLAEIQAGVNSLLEKGEQPGNVGLDKIIKIVKYTVSGNSFSDLVSIMKLESKKDLLELSVLIVDKIQELIDALKNLINNYDLWTTQLEEKTNTIKNILSTSQKLCGTDEICSEGTCQGNIPISIPAAGSTVAVSSREVSLKTYSKQYLSSDTNGDVKAIDKKLTSINFLFEYKRFDSKLNANVFCIKNINNNHYLTAEGDQVHHLTCSHLNCGPNEEWLLDERTVEGKKVCYIESLLWRKIISVESEENINSNSVWKNQKEVFYLEDPIYTEDPVEQTVPDEPNLQRSLSLRTSLQNYLVSNREGEISVKATKTSLLTNFVITKIGVDKTTNRNVYCILNSYTKKYLSVSSKSPANANSDNCGDSEEFFITEQTQNKITFWTITLRKLKSILNYKADLELSIEKTQNPEMQKFYPDEFIEEETSIEGIYALRTYWNTYICANSKVPITSDTSNKALCSSLEFIKKSVDYDTRGKIIYCIKSIMTGLFVRGEDDSTHTITASSSACKEQEEFYVDVQGHDGNPVWYIESRAWSTVMTSESNLALTVNRIWKRNWEQFFPEVPVLSENSAGGIIALKTSYGSYLCARIFAPITAAASMKTLCSNFEIILKGVDPATRRNIYCIKSVLNGLYVTSQSDPSHSISCDQKLCSTLEEFYIDVQVISSVKTWYIESKFWNTVISYEVNKNLVASETKKKEMQKFFPETKIDTERIVQSVSVLRTSTNNYMCAKSDGSLTGAAKMLACSQFKVSRTSVDSTSKRNVYCILSQITNKYISVGNPQTFELACNKASCSQSEEFFLEDIVIDNKRVWFLESKLYNKVVTFTGSNFLASKESKLTTEYLYPETYNATLAYLIPGLFSMKSYWDTFVCTDNEGSVYATSSVTAPCTIYDIIYKRDNNGRAIYCVKSKGSGKYLTANADNTHRVSGSAAKCESSQEFYIDQETIDSQLTTFFTSVKWSTSMTAEMSLDLTVNRTWKRSWERFILIPQ